jgi:hypothetical protein
VFWEQACCICYNLEYMTNTKIFHPTYMCFIHVFKLMISVCTNCKPTKNKFHAIFHCQIVEWKVAGKDCKPLKNKFHTISIFKLLDVKFVMYIFLYFFMLFWFLNIFAHVFPPVMYGYLHKSTITFLQSLIFLPLLQFWWICLPWWNVSNFIFHVQAVLCSPLPFKSTCSSTFPYCFSLFVLF